MVWYVSLECVVLLAIIQMSHVMGKWSKVCPSLTKGNRYQLTLRSRFLIRFHCVIFDGICNRVVNAFFDRNSLLLYNLPVNCEKNAFAYYVTIIHNSCFSPYYAILYRLAKYDSWVRCLQLDLVCSKCWIWSWELRMPVQYLSALPIAWQSNSFHFQLKERWLDPKNTSTLDKCHQQVNMVGKTNWYPRGIL